VAHVGCKNDLFLKCEIALGKVTEGYHDHCCEDFGYRRVNTKLFYKKFNEDVVQEDTGRYEQYVPE
jgi:hypothetical protein